MTVAVVTLALLLVASGALHVVRERDASTERARLVNAVLAKTPAEFAQLERLVEPKIRRMRGPDSDAPAAVPIGLA